MSLKVYTISEVAQILKIHRTYVARLIRHRKLPAIKIGKFYRVREEDLEQFLNSAKV
jgi:excisionase family DNA binding protein